MGRSCFYSSSSYILSLESCINLLPFRMFYAWWIADEAGAGHCGAGGAAVHHHPRGHLGQAPRRRQQAQEVNIDWRATHHPAAEACCPPSTTLPSNNFRPYPSSLKRPMLKLAVGWGRWRRPRCVPPPSSEPYTTEGLFTTENPVCHFPDQSRTHMCT